MVEAESGRRELTDQVISINRVTKVVKGGKNLSFSALVVVGDKQGRVGYGMGKAKEVPVAIRKGIDKAKRALVEIPMSGSTIPHAVMGTFGSGRVMLKPAQEGTGVIAGGTVRAVMESAGIKDVVTKSLGSANPSNIVKATFQGLLQLRSPAQVAKTRGIAIEDLYWPKAKPFESNISAAASVVRSVKRKSFGAWGSKSSTR